METEVWNGTDTDLRDYIKVYEGLTDLKFCASVIDSFIEDKDKYAEYIDSLSFVDTKSLVCSYSICF